MRRLSISIIAAVAMLLVSGLSHAQSMTLNDAVETARRQSVTALAARSAFISDYWSYRAYKASLLPSLSLYGNLASFDRSLRLLQNYETGEMVYTNNYNMQNSLGLALTQNVSLTGGTMSLYSDLSRIDQFGLGGVKTWYSQPVTFSYAQPLFAYNRFKWDREISPREYEKAKREYVEKMEEVTVSAVSLFFNLVQARQNWETAMSNYANTCRMRDIASEKSRLGVITRDEYLQLELRALNDSISINESVTSLREAQMTMSSFLGIDGTMDISPVISEELPDVVMDYDMVMSKAMKNSSFVLSNEISVLNAEAAVAQAKANRGLAMQLNARFGLSKSDTQFAAAYRHLLDQEVVGLSFSIPIFDWGLGRGRVKKAEAAADVVRAQVEQSENEYRSSIFTAVGQFNNQRQQCMASRRARDIAEERYELVMDRFSRGEATVLEFNNAQSEKDGAVRKYAADLGNFWNYYYTLRQLTLYDFINAIDIDVPVSEMAE